MTRPSSSRACVSRPTEECGWRIGHAALGPVTHAAEIVQRRNHRLARGRRIECGSLQQSGEQRAYPPPMRPQFLISPVFRSGDQAVDTGHGGFDIGPRDLLEQGVCHSTTGSASYSSATTYWPTSRNMMAAASRSRSERSLDFMCASSAHGEYVGRQGIEEFDRVVERGGFQGLEQSREGGHSPRLVQRCQAAGLAVRALRASRPSGAAGKSVDRSGPGRGCEWRRYAPDAAAIR